MGYQFFTSGPLQFEATTIARAHHPRVLHDDQDQTSFGISKPVAGRMTTALVGTPSFTAPSQSRTVGPSTAPPSQRGLPPTTTPSRTPTPWHKRPVPLPRQVVLHRAGSQPVRLLGGTDKELCEGEVLLQIERDFEPCSDPQVRRQVIEELL